MYRLIVILAILGFGYLLYDMYGYRYVINDIRKDANQSMMMGEIDSDINILAYIDYDSPSSKRLYPVLLNLLAADPQVSVILRPVETDSNTSKLATRIALSAKNQNRFMDVNNVLLASNIDLDQNYIEGATRSLGLNFNRLKSDAMSYDIESEILKYQTEASLLKIQNFPVFFVDHVRLEGSTYTVGELQGIIRDLRTGRL